MLHVLVESETTTTNTKYSKKTRRRVEKKWHKKNATSGSFWYDMMEIF